MAKAKRIAPIFPARDVGASLDHYRQLGFSAREYEGGGYGFVTLDRIEIHLGAVPDDAPFTPASAYIFVDDADDMAQVWASRGGDVRPPQDTEWGQREGVLVDHNGNVIRFGSPLPE